MYLFIKFIRLHQENIKEVRGLTERLQGLDKLMFDSKNLVQDQSVHATSFQQNQTNANKLNDPTIFPNLCESHSSQLQSMLDNHRKLRDIRRRISKAKEELGANLVQRLKYVIHLENRMSELDSKLLFYNRSLRRVQRHLVVIEQIHNAPEMYVHAVTEVIRRRTFSNAFLKVSSEQTYEEILLQSIFLLRSGLLNWQLVCWLSTRTRLRDVNRSRPCLKVIS